MTKRQEGAAPQTPRTRAGLCGRCSGKLVYDADLSADKCFACSRLAGPPTRTPAEVRQGVLTELDALFEDSDPAVFWSKFVLVADLARIIMSERKTLLSWCYTNKFKPTTRRHPDTGRRVLFLTVEQARSIIEARK